MTHEIVRTRSGAMAVRCTEAGEVMHPGVGPLLEAQRLYVEQSRLAERLRGKPGGPPLVLFDVGLGAGSNALAAWAASEAAGSQAARLEIVSFERDVGALALALRHGDAFGLPEGSAAAMAATELLETGRHETGRTCWRLVAGDVLDALAREPARADVVFWDPFSPRVNPALWTVAAFAALRAVAAPRCTLYTYSASTRTRVALLLAGWAVGVGDAIGDKEETTAAALVVDDLARPLPDRFRARLLRPDVPLPPDAPADGAARAAAAPQFTR